MAAAVAAVEAAAKDPEEMAALSEFAEGKKADGTLVDKPSQQAKNALKAISKAAETDFNQFALARSWSTSGKAPGANDDLEAESPQGHRKRLQFGDHLLDHEILSRRACWAWR